jgi:uncharacterized protein
MFLWIAIVTTYVIAENFGCAVLQVWLLRRRQPSPKRLEYFVFAWAFLMSVVLVLQIFEPVPLKPFLREWLYWPMSVGMVWNLIFLQVFFPGMILVVLLVRIFGRRAQPKTLTAEGISRRKFLYLVSYGALPTTALGMGVHGALTRDELRVRQFDIPIVNLPPEWEGYTIAHVSDLHSGIFVGPKRLKNISDTTNDLKADLVAVTGDIINREMNEFPAALAAIQRMESRHGLYLCEGNHDAIPGPYLVVVACEQNHLRMLFNHSVIIPGMESRLLLGGLSWNRTFQMIERPGMVGDLFPQRQAGDVRILLAHHPDLFDIAQDTDLVLSGHTHGGQIMLGDNIGLGRLRFRYCSGRFVRDNTTMIVSNGCGDWFPCRIGAPAEIGLIRLTRAVA